MNEITLSGCHPVPLASYLKALAVLRLVSEQKDNDAKGWWSNQRFRLKSNLSNRDLEHFFAEEYRPTPLVTPWNGGSGFLPKDVGSKKYLESIRKSEAKRFADYRTTIDSCLNNPAQIEFCELKEKKDKLGKIPKKKKTEDEKAEEKEVESKLNALKQDLIALHRATLPAEALKWFDAAVLVTEHGAKFPPLLGTGGNDGRLEFSNNFMQRLVELIDLESGKPTGKCVEQLKAALWDVASFSNTKSPIGQFEPGAVGGPNASTGYNADSSINRWNYVLMLEGALLFASSAMRRSEELSGGELAFPYTVRSSNVGYGSNADSDAKAARAETWMPLWSRPTTLPELRYLLSEGRVTVGRRPARTGTDFARAVASLGVDRGLHSFERYGFLQRSGKAFLATPLGRWVVLKQPNMDLVKDIDSWFDRFSSVARSENTPNSFKRAHRTVESAVMNVCRRSEPRPWQALLMALGQAEAIMARSPQTTAEAAKKIGLAPLPPLRPGWLRAADDGSREFRLACSLSSVWSVRRSGKRILPSLRGHMVPLSPSSRKYARFHTDDMNSNDVVWKHGSLAESMIAVVMRRLNNAKSSNLTHPPLTGFLPAANPDLLSFIAGRIDMDRIEALLWGLNAIEWRNADISALSRPNIEQEVTLPAAYALVRLAYLPFELSSLGNEAKGIPFDTAIMHALSSGRASRATELCARRLVGAGIQPLVRKGVFMSPRQARLLAAATLFPISAKQIYRMAFEVTRTGRESRQHKELGQAADEQSSMESKQPDAS